MSSGILKDRLENEEVNRLGGSANLGCVDLNPTRAPGPATVALRRKHCFGSSQASPIRMHHRNSCAVHVTSGSEKHCAGSKPCSRIPHDCPKTLSATCKSAR